MTQGAAEKLLTATDPVTGALLYTFGRGTKLSVPLTAKSVAYAVPGALRKFDPRGDSPAPLEGDDVSWEFNWKYGTAESWSTVHRQLVAAFGHFRPVLLTKQDSDGTQMQARCRCLSIPGDMDLDALFYGKYTLTFEKLEDWRSATRGGSPIYGTGLIYGTTGLKYSTGGVTTTITTQFQNISVTNNGDATDWTVQINFVGPLDSCTLYNTSMDVSGRFYPAGATPDGTLMMAVSIPFALAAGEYLVVQGSTGDVQTNHPGVVGWAAVTVTPGQQAFFALAPGINPLQLDQASATTGGQVSLVYYDRWR